MTIQEKVLYIIKLLELSDRQVATATGKALSTINHKRLQLGRNKFTDEDLQNLKAFYIEKLKEIESLA
nr:MAG TPA: hypothetical protein [Caudoviricetes sp.]